jgi:hypothetical protein
VPNKNQPASLPVRYENIPTSLQAIDRWVLWKFLQDGDQWKKVPLQVNGKAAKSNDPTTWATFSQVVDAHMFGDFDGIGVVIDGSGDFQGIDLDDCLQDGQLNDLAKEVLARVDGYAEISPSGSGIKIFTRSNLSTSGKRGQVEAYCTGRYFTVTGHSINGHAQLPDQVQDVGWFVDRFFGQQTERTSLDALALYKPPLPDWDIDRVRSDLVPHVGSLESYDQWLAVGMALHHQGQGDAAWMSLWDELSRATASYDRRELVEKWRSFSEQRGSGSGAITLASLIKRAGDSRAEERRSRFEQYKTEISEAQDPESLQAQVCTSIQSDHDLDRLNRDVLAQLLRSRFKALGFPIALPDVKRLIRPRMATGMPEWLSDWVYLTHEDKFFNTQTKRRVSTMGFNAMFNREVGGLDNETKAASVALDVYKISTPDKVIYLPSAPDHFDLNGMPCVNGYDHSSPPDIPASFSQSDQMAIEAIQAHLALILEDHQAVGTMLAWMAHNVQHPGQKIRWSPLVKGIEGDGKTVLGKVMAGAMGIQNVGIVSPAVLQSPFTGWAEGRCVNILEEIRMVGHNRYDVLNALKPYITNDQITVHPKGVNEYLAPNTVNYIAFTNHKDALPLEETDRRWWVQFTPFETQAELRAATGPDYFNRLHSSIENHAGAIRRWLMEYQIPDSFDPNGQAPASSSKLKMVAMNMTDDEVVIRELIETGAPGVHPDAVCSASLTTALSLMDDVEVPRTQALSRVMTKLGFERMGWQISWHHKSRRIWLRHHKYRGLNRDQTTTKVRDLLDSTLRETILD